MAPDLAEAHLSRGISLTLSRKFEEADEALQVLGAAVASFLLATAGRRLLACGARIHKLSHDHQTGRDSDANVQVLRKLGQPTSRIGNEYVYCVEGGLTATIVFGEDGKVPGGTDPDPEPTCRPPGRPVASGDGHPSSGGHEVPGKPCKK